MEHHLGHSDQQARSEKAEADAERVHADSFDVSIPATTGSRFDLARRRRDAFGAADKTFLESCAGLLIGLFE